MSVKMIDSNSEQDSSFENETLPAYRDWSQLLALFKHAAENDQHSLLLTMLMTADEREALVARVNIFSELLKGKLSQRQISQMLGVGVATITRGSNELKNQSPQQKEMLAKLLLQG